MTDKELITLAAGARKNAYAPYSDFRVGAALLCADGKVYTGCNIEVSSASPTCCAERTAFFKAISEGERDFLKIAVAGGKGDEEPADICPPCGVCRQVMSEFCGSDFEIIMSANGEPVTKKLSELLPLSFGRLE